MMSRNHVRAMMGSQGLGYAVAKRVLDARKVRGEYYVYLEELRKAQLATERIVATTSDEEEQFKGWCEPRCGVCAILARTSQKKSSTLFSPRMVVG